ncbi:MAG: flagellar brake protein [Thiogranum sp.]
MEYSELKLQVGETIQLQPRDGEDSRRLHGKIIGYLPGASLLVTTPRTRDKVMIIREGQPFVVRMMMGNRIVGFTSTVLRSCARPYPYLHLSFPEEMEQIIVRKAQRIGVKLFASLKNDNPDYQFEKPHSATIVDISTSGALLVASEQLGDVDDKVIVTSVLKFAGTEKMLAIPAVLRSVHADQAPDITQDMGYYHGLEFDIKDQQDVITLHGFVYENIVKSQTD